MNKENSYIPFVFFFYLHGEKKSEGEQQQKELWMIEIKSFVNASNRS